MNRQELQRPGERFVLDRFLDWRGVHCSVVEDCKPPEPDFALILADGRRVGVELTVASESVLGGGAVQGTIASAIDRKRKRLPTYKASGIDEVWLIVYTSATVDGPDGLRRLEKEEVSSRSGFDRVYFVDMVTGCAVQRWPRAGVSVVT